MTDQPKAHRRLVPRVPKKPEPPKELPKEEVIIDTTRNPRVDFDDGEDSMEMTAVRESPMMRTPPTRLTPQPPAPRPPELEPTSIDPDDSLDITVQRGSAPPGELDLDDDNETVMADPDEANETMALPAARDLLDTAPPDPVAEPPPRRAFPIPSYAMTAAKEGAMPRFGPNWNTLAGGSQPGPPGVVPVVAPAVAAGSQSLRSIASGARVVPQAREDEPNAFSDLEPTSLKAPIHPGDAEDRPTTHISPAERGLLAAMSEGHEASRKIYMQWLERRGEKTRAEYLKVEMQLASMNPLDIRFQETQDQLRDIAQKISVDWRSRVSRSLIENCKSAARCPAYWRALPNDADDVRKCQVCGDQVYYCVTIELARGRVVSGQRVALDVTVERSPDDLAAQPICGNCGNQMPANTRFCPHCGRSTQY